MKKKVLKLFWIFIVISMIFGMINLPKNAVAQAPEPHLEKVEERVLNSISTNGISDFVIEMTEKADLSKAYSITDWNERGWYVYDTLREVAARTQKPVIEILEKQGVKYQSFFAGNEIAVYGSGLNTLTEITSLKAVDHIRFPRTATIDPSYLSIHLSSVPQATVDSLNWGITDTKADQFWATFDLQGDGLVVANIDTGVQWDHPALDRAFKCGTDPSDPVCWKDPSNFCGGSACDNNGHGTHTMGTMVGDDDPSLPYQVGMAPNAQWIACKGCESNSCSDTALNACADWILAPGGDPTNRPNIVNNSWGDVGGNNWYLTKVNAWRAAGIFPAFSAGNSGPTCGSIGSPGDYQESFAVANHMSNRTIANSSSRGPSSFGHDPYTKPNISAPGTNICSSVPGSGWECGYSGTSMASPHVAGAVALLWSCDASLIGDMTATFELLQDTADTPTYTGNCGAPPDGEGNFTYGYGYLNVLAAGQQVCSAGTVTGTVMDNSDNPIDGATVTASNSAGLSIDTLTLSNGTYTLNVPEGTYKVTATKYGYSKDSKTDVMVVKGQTTTVDFVITPFASTVVSGKVYDGGVEGLGFHGYPLYSAIKITAPGFNQTIYTDPFTGYYEIELAAGTAHNFTVEPIPNGYDAHIESVTPSGTSYNKNFQVTVGTACSAPGYFGSGVNEGFDTTSLPEGWVNYDYNGSGGVWRFDDPKTRGNLTPGQDGGFAILDSDYYGYGKSQDAGLRTPVMDFTNETLVTLEFDTYFKQYGSSSATVRVSNDGGSTWTDVWSTTTTLNEHVTVDISDYAAGKSAVIVEFKYVGSWGWYWEVDDVLITPIDCALITGGVVAGYVKDAIENAPIVGADVVSEDVSTKTFSIPDHPASEGLYWVFQPTTATDPQNVVFTASKNLYGNDIKTVSVAQNAVNRQDFTLGAGHLIFNPTSLEATMTMGDSPLTKDLVITNNGSAPVTFELVEKDKGSVLSKVNIPAFKGELPEDTRPISIGLDPLAENASRLNGTADDLFKGILSDAPAFAVDLIPNPDNLKYIPDTTVPGSWNSIGPTRNSLYAGDFLAGDFSTLYAISSDDNNLYTVDTTTGAATLVGTATPPAGHAWTGLSGAPNGTFYGLTTDGSVSILMTVDPMTGAVTQKGEIQGVAIGIDLAYNTEDKMIYIVDIVTDSLFRVDPDTLTTTQVGPLGVNANYAQGMDFEEDSGVLYWAAYTTTSELRIIDTTTGASSLVGAFPGGTEVDCLAFATGGVSDVPWLSEDPVSGTVGTEDPVTVEVTFDPTGAGLSQPGDYLAELKVRHNSPYTYPNIPVTLHLKAPSNYGTFKGHVYGLKTCDVDPTALKGATVNFWQNGAAKFTTTTNAEGYYSYALPEGTYDIEVLSDGYISKLEQAQAVAGGQTTTVNFDLRLQAPCLVVSPASLEQTQPSDTVTTQTLTIENKGAAQGIFELIELPVTPLQLDQLIQDPSFEDGSPNSYWDEFSLEFNTPLCTVAGCGTGGGTGPKTGNWWTWFGGSNTGDTGYVSQSVTLLPGTAELSFYVEQEYCGNAGASNYLALKIDDTEVWRTNGSDPACGELGYRLVTVDVSDFADGDSHLIKFESVTVDLSNFFLDDVELNLEPGADVPWLAEDPTAGVVPADSIINVTITYNSTGLANGNYFATLRVKNPPAAPINIPVTLHITSLQYLYLPLILK